LKEYKRDKPLAGFLQFPRGGFKHGLLNSGICYHGAHIQLAEISAMVKEIKNKPHLILRK